MDSSGSSRKLSIINHLIRRAMNQEKVGSSRIAAVVVYKNKMFYGFNSYKSHPFQAKHGKNPDSIYLHAEINAINKARKALTSDELKRATLYIARVKGRITENTSPDDLQWGLAKPCGNNRCGCQSVIHMFNIGRVVFTTDTKGVYEEWETNFNDYAF